MKRPIRALAALAALVALPVVVFAADHGDSPTAAATEEPTADLTDLYAWMSADATRLNLIAAVNSDAGPNATFSDAVTYVFSVSSSQGYGQPQESTRIICKFIEEKSIECWAGADYVFGDPSDPAGIVSDSGGFRVFAGLRDDPFFLEYTGFAAAVTEAVRAVGADEVSFDEQRCPLLTPAQGAGLRGLLASGAEGAPATNTFAGQRVLALVLQVDKSIVDGNGPVLGVSVSTHAGN